MAFVISAPVTSAVAGGLGVLYAAMQMRVGLYRKNSGINSGTKTAAGVEDEHLSKISRVGGNFGEYLPIGAFTLFLLETATDLPHNTVAAYGAAFTFVRLLHAFALENADNKNQKLHLLPRAAGMIGTFLTLATGGGYLAVKGLRALANRK